MVDLISNSTAIAEKTPKKSNLHKKRKLVIIAGVCLIIAAAAIFYFKSFTGSESTAVQQETATITKGDLTEYINATGPVEAASRKVLTSMVTTEISKINFKEGDKVKKGEVLFELDASDARTNIVNTQQSIAEAQQNLDESLKNLEEMKIKAPFSGYVSNISIKNDDSVKNGQTLMTLTDTSRLTLSLPFNLTD
ncbi:MAG: biotin/lipoyl-binding protein, partial [Clostridiales bacterium]|nr:biotin/lipoyl-binding protein [Clostridiales bacterium]